MKNIESKHFRILAIAPSTRGFGFAVLEGRDKLIDWGVKSIKEDKNTGSLEKVKEMILHYMPGVVVMENTSSKESRRSARIRALSKEIVALAKSLDVKVALLSRAQVRKAFFADGQGTKHALAQILAARFPEELASRLPPNSLTLLQDYQQGNDPTNYYSQGGGIVTPTLTITSGNNQSVQYSTFATSALVVQVIGNIGISDAWQNTYFGHTGIDPTADPMNSGLTNLQKYLFGYDPTKFSSNGDGLSDAVNHQLGIAGNNYYISGDGLTNAQNLALGIDPFNTNEAPITPPATNPSDHTAPTINLNQPANATLLP